MVDALAANPRLSCLLLEGSRLSDAFIAERLTPAVRQCASLRLLAIGAPAGADAEAMARERMAAHRGDPTATERAWAAREAHTRMAAT